MRDSCHPVSRYCGLSEMLASRRNDVPPKSAVRSWPRKKRDAYDRLELTTTLCSSTVYGAIS